MRKLVEITEEVIKAQNAEFIIKSSFESNSNMDGSEQQSVVAEYTGDIEKMDMKRLAKGIVSRAYSDIMSFYKEPGNAIVTEGDNGLLMYQSPGRGIVVMAQESDLNIYVTAIVALD